MHTSRIVSIVCGVTNVHDVDDVYLLSLTYILNMFVASRKRETKRSEMAESPQFVLYEHAVGYALFRIKEFEEIGQAIPEVCVCVSMFNNVLSCVQVEASIADVAKFGAVVKLHAFDPFKNTEAALDNCNSISEGIRCI